MAECKFCAAIQAAIGVRVKARLEAQLGRVVNLYDGEDHRRFLLEAEKEVGAVARAVMRCANERLISEELERIAGALTESREQREQSGESAAPSGDSQARNDTGPPHKSKKRAKGKKASGAGLQKPPDIPTLGSQGEGAV